MRPGLPARPSVPDKGLPSGGGDFTFAFVHPRPGNSTAGRWWRRPGRVAGLGAAGGFILVVMFAAWRITTHNAGVVQPGRLYRSGQLDGPSFRGMILADGIRTVINLRGKNERSAWYRDEIALCRELGVRHVDVSWSATHLPAPEEVTRLLQAYHELPTPMLLHCRSGSDRTGLASALFLIDQDHVPWREARQALNCGYGHFAIYPYFEMDEFVQLYGQDSGKRLADWVAQDYPAIYAKKSQESKWDKIIDPFRLAIQGSL